MHVRAPGQVRLWPAWSMRSALGFPCGFGLLFSIGVGLLLRGSGVAFLSKNELNVTTPRLAKLPYPNPHMNIDRGDTNTDQLYSEVHAHLKINCALLILAQPSLSLSFFVFWRPCYFSSIPLLTRSCFFFSRHQAPCLCLTRPVYFSFSARAGVVGLVCGAFVLCLI